MDKQGQSVLLFPQAYEEVQSFFSSSFPSCVFSDLAKALDSKCQVFDKLSALLKDITFGKSRNNDGILSASMGLQTAAFKSNVLFDYNIKALFTTNICMCSVLY